HLPYVLAARSFVHTSSPCIYPLSLHDALPIFFEILLVDLDLAHHVLDHVLVLAAQPLEFAKLFSETLQAGIKNQMRIIDQIFDLDRKSTRLNSSHVKISYAVFCLKKKNNIMAT